MTRFLLPVITLLILGCTAGATRSQLPAPQERLGIRSGYLETTGALDEHFGDGSFMTIHFTEKIIEPLYLDIRIGAIYLGDLLKPDVVITAVDVESEMRILFFTAGPQYTYSMSDRTTLFGAIGMGIYSVSILEDSGLQAMNASNQHFGLNAGLGLLWRFSATWNVDVSFTTHKLWTPEDPGCWRASDCIYYAYTDEHTSPVLFQFGVGITMDLR